MGTAGIDWCITIISTRSYFMETNACSIVSKNACRKRQMSITYYMKTPSIKLHQSSRRWLLFWPQHHAQRNVRSADSGGDRFTFVTPWDSIDSIVSLSPVLSAPMEIKSLSTVWTRWLTFSDNAMEGRTFSFNASSITLRLLIELSMQTFNWAIFQMIAVSLDGKVVNVSVCIPISSPTLSGIA